jgi:hypothetical protein
MAANPQEDRDAAEMASGYAKPGVYYAGLCCYINCRAFEVKAGRSVRLQKKHKG